MTKKKGMSAAEIQRCASGVPSARTPPSAALGKAPCGEEDTESSEDDDN